jgi:hypothetical protein
LSAPRPDLNTIRTQYQVPDDEVITYRPRAYGAVDIPFTSGRQMTKTEGELLDSLTLRRGLLGLREFKDIASDAFTRGVERFPDNTVPSGLAEDRVREWQGNDGHRDAFRHAYWSARLAQEYGSDWARAFTTAHEGLPGNVANREAMDLYNNSIGLRIGAANPNATSEQLADLIQEAVTRGDTVVINSGGNLQWSDRVPIGQHGLTREEVIDPHMRTPDVVPTKSVAAMETTNGLDGRSSGTAVAAAPEPHSSTTPLSPSAQALLTDSEQQVRHMAERHGILWDKGLDNTVAAVAHHARAEGLTGINKFHVSNGQIRYGQYDGYTLKDGSIDARVAANTPAIQSREMLAETDRVMSQPKEIRIAEQPVQDLSLRA